MNEPKYSITYYEDCSVCGGSGCSYCVDGYFERTQVFDSKNEFDHAINIVESNPNVVLVIRKVDEA